jgi:hypothetical protein
LDTANLLSNVEHDPTYATHKEIDDFKRKNRKEGEERKKSMAGSINRYVIIENNTAVNKKFITTEFLLVATLEAKTNEGKWTPIQYFQPTPNIKRAYDFDLELKSMQKFVAIDTNKYSGDTKVAARYKFLTNVGFVYSNEFQIEIDECLAHGISNRSMDSLSQKNVYFLDTVISRKK